MWTFRDLVPILAVLQFNTWFTGLSVDGFKLVGN